VAVDPAVMFSLAEELTTIPDCPRSEAAVKAVAKDLFRYCQSNDEAIDLVRKAREDWASWKGTAGLIEILQSMRRGPESVPLERRTIDLGPKPAVNCAACQDWGYIFRDGRNQYCACAMGVQMEADGLLDSLKMRKMNMRSLQSVPAPRPVTEADLEAAFKQRQKDNESMIARMKAVIEDPAASKEEKEMAREYLEGMDTGQAS